jgi:hypothetical protein
MPSRIVLVKSEPRGFFGGEHLQMVGTANYFRSVDIDQGCFQRSSISSCISRSVSLTLGRPGLPGMVLSQHSELPGCDLIIASFSGVKGLHGP